MLAHTRIPDLLESRLTGSGGGSGGGSSSGGSRSCGRGRHDYFGAALILRTLGSRTLSVCLANVEVRFSAIRYGCMGFECVDV